MNQPVSRSGDRNCETPAIVADPIVVDAQKKRSRVMHREGFARADEKKPIGQNANRGRALENTGNTDGSWVIAVGDSIVQ
jgi:hypothetical protein